MLSVLLLDRTTTHHSLRNHCHGQSHHRLPNHQRSCRVKSVSTFRRNSLALEQRYSHTHAGYIIDIKAEKTNNCPEGYYPLVNYTWPGSLDGCYCNSNQNGYAFDFVMKGKCSSELIAQGCSTVSAMGSEVMNMWKGSSLLCYKRADSMTFYNSVIKNAPPGGSSSNMTSCGDNQTYQVYTLPGVECPITAVSNTTVGTSQVTLTLDSTHGNILNFINKTNYPIADFKLT